MTDFYTGVIEDVMDPLKLGRVRVRVFGLHTDDKNLIPTETLPWATVVMPTTSASVSGVGISLGGAIPGSWVLVIFQDKECQYPIVIGALPGYQTSTEGQVTSDGDYLFSDSESPTANVLRDSSGTIVTDGSGNPIQTTDSTGTDSTDTKPSPKKSSVNPSELGSVSEEFESSGNPGAINVYASGIVRDGAAYGLYQMVSYLIAPGIKSRSNISDSDVKNSPINVYLRTSKWKSEFEGLSPASPAFDAKWKAIASAHRSEFIKEQHAYAERVYYQSAVNKLPSSISNRGRAIHEAIWSMSIQLGVAGCVSKFKSTVGDVDSSVCDSKVIEILYDARIKTVSSDFKSSPGVWNHLINVRFPKEKSRLIAIANTYETSGSCSSAVVTKVEPKIKYEENGKKTIVEEIKTTTEYTKGDRGFRDPSGKYPLYRNEADTNRLARGVQTGTIVEAKRRSVVTGRDSGFGLISEPSTQYNAKYPFNKVTVTQSGHVIELDDTEGYERIHIYHRCGTFVEMHPDGKMVTKVKDNNTLVVNGDDNTIVLGAQNTNVEGNKNETVNGTLTLVVIGSVDASIGGNFSANITGNAQIESFGVGGISITSYVGDVSVNALRSVSVRAGLSASVIAGASVSVTAGGPLSINSASAVSITAPIITMN